jgi:hypothetical protein
VDAVMAQFERVFLDAGRSTAAGHPRSEAA